MLRDELEAVVRQMPLEKAACLGLGVGEESAADMTHARTARRTRPDVHSHDCATIVLSRPRRPRRAARTRAAHARGPRRRGARERDPGHDRDDHEAADAGVQQDEEPQRRTPEAIRPPDERLHPELAPVRRARAEPGGNGYHAFANTPISGRPIATETKYATPTTRSARPAARDRPSRCARRAPTSAWMTTKTAPTAISATSRPRRTSTPRARANAVDAAIAGTEPRRLPHAVEDEHRHDRLACELREAAAEHRAATSAPAGRLGARRKRRSCRSHHSIPHSQ